MEKPYTLSVKVVMRNVHDQCLLLRRSAKCKSNVGKWDFPGGKLDPGESIDAALRREVLEETGLAISIRRIAGAAESELPDRKVAYLMMEAVLDAGTLCLSEEHDAYQWLPIHALPSVNLPQQFKQFVLSYIRSTEGNV